MTSLEKTPETYQEAVATDAASLVGADIFVSTLEAEDELQIMNQAEKPTEEQ